MSSKIAKYSVGRCGRHIRYCYLLPSLLGGIGSLLVICLSGCSRSEGTSPETSPLARSIFFHPVEASECSARCVPTTLAVAREALGLDPEVPAGNERLSANAAFDSLEEEGREVGAAITRIPVEDVIERITKGPAPPVALVHKSGHLYVLFGAIEVNNKLLCQLVHGSEPVSLVTKQAILKGEFQEAWRFQKKEGAGIPIHIGNASIEIDKLWHNFGETFPDKSLECTFHLRNTGDRTVILDRPVVSCQCAVSDINNKTILAPGEVLDLRVSTKAVVSTSLRNSIELTFFEQGSGKPRKVSLALIGSQREPMEVTPAKLDFGLVIPGKTYSRTVSLREKPTDRFVLKGVDIGGLRMDHRVEVVRDRNGFATYRVNLDLKADDAGALEEGELTLTTDSFVRPKIVVPVRFRVEPPVRAVPSIVSVGTIPAGKSVERKVKLISRSGEIVHIKIESHPDECSIAVNDSRNPSEMAVTVQLMDHGVWDGIIRTKVSCGSLEHFLDIRCVGFAQARPE